MRAVATGVLIGVLAGGALLGQAPRAQPVPADLQRAKDLYTTAETAMKEGRFADAARDYGAAFDITRDPVLFYKIGIAHQRAGKCDLATIYFGRYLKEARPTEAFFELAKQRIVECGGDPRAYIRQQPPDAGSGSASAGSAGSAATVPPDAGGGSAGAGGGSDRGSDGSASGGTIAMPSAGAGSGSAAPSAVGKDRAAWLLVASSLAFVTIGAVLAYSANSAESDVSDLYVGFAGQPPEFDAKTQATYDDLIAEGKRFEMLSWVSFGLAGATGVAAAILFATRDREKPVTVTPTVSTDGAGVRAVIKF